MIDDHLVKRFIEVRRYTESICSKLEIEDFVVQPVPEVSPPKWHLAHTTWFLEELIINKFQINYDFHDNVFRKLFNSYYKGLGEHWLQSARGQLSRPTVKEIYTYREIITQKILELMSHQKNNYELEQIIELAINHEEQHIELLYMDIKFILGANPSLPAYDEMILPAIANATSRWEFFSEGLYEIGADSAKNFYYDNEAPKHKIFLRPYAIRTTLVTNGEYLEFIESNGYEIPTLWLSKGLDWVKNNNIKSPLYWFKEDGLWYEFTLHGKQLLDKSAPVTHVSYFEAEAYARWKDLRLPTEGEFEIYSLSKKNLKKTSTFLHPESVNTLDSQLWCWTQSSYSPYPGYRPFAGAVGEYNGKFMCNQFVLKGGCFATPSGHYRNTYRNFYEPHQRWMFSGIVLAKDLI
jgi:ergothioneine biosynthesis protein EgtB